MSVAPESSVEGQTEFKIVQALITSARTPAQVDIKNLITDFEIYENINLPYLTANFSFVDQENIVQDIDFQGGEKLSVEIVHIEEMNSGETISKEFLIDTVSNVTKVDERNEIVFIHCIEYHSFVSSLKNVNKAYSGSPSSMIQKIFGEFLSQQTAIVGDDGIKDMKLIVPNLHPIEACQWIKKRTLTQDGMPFYFYSTIGLNNMVLKDLGTMLSQPIINKKVPYIYAPSLNSSKSLQSYYTIQKFSYSDTENLVGLIREGMVGANYNFYDTTTGLQDPFHFDVDAKVFKRLSSQNKIGLENTKYNYAPDYKVDGKRLHDFDSKQITEINATGAYTTNTTVFKSYGEEGLKGSNAKKVIQKAIKGFLGKTPITIVVRGRDFITADANYSIGKSIRINFLDNRAFTEEGGSTLDKKKSGDYLILSAKHSFKLEKIDTTLVCGKIGSLGNDAEVIG